MADDSSAADSTVRTPARDRTRPQQRAAREAERGSRRVAVEWVVIPAIIVLVFAIGFGLKLVVG